MQVNERIREYMKQKKISQNKLAKSAMISQSGLSSIISGAVSPKESTLRSIASALGLSLSELVGESLDFEASPRVMDDKKSFRNLPPEFKKLVTTDQPVHLPDIAPDENGDGLPDHLVLDFGSSETNPALFGGINDALMRLFDEAGDLSSEEADLTRAFVLGLKAKRKAAAAPPPSNQK